MPVWMYASCVWVGARQEHESELPVLHPTKKENKGITLQLHCKVENSGKGTELLKKEKLETKKEK